MGIVRLEILEMANTYVIQYGGLYWLIVLAILIIIYGLTWIQTKKPPKIFGSDSDRQFKELSDKITAIEKRLSKFNNAKQTSKSKSKTKIS